MENIDCDLDVVEGLSIFSKIAFNSQLFLGNWKKKNCKNFDGSFCQVWAWKNDKGSEPNRNFTINTTLGKNGETIINPDQFFCALCPKWIESKATKSKPEKK